MTYEEKVRWLRRYQESLQIEKELEQEIEQLRTRACRATRCLTGIPGGEGDGQAIPRAVERIIEAQKELQKNIRESEMIRGEIADNIERIGNPKEREVLRRRYLLGETWERISEKMGMDERWIRRLHRRIIIDSSAIDM